MKKSAKKEKQGIELKYVIAAIILIPYVLYLMPCFVRSFFPNLCCIPTKSTPSKQNNTQKCIEKEEIEIVEHIKEVVVENKLPCPKKDPQNKIERVEIHKPAQIPKDIVDGMTEIQSRDFEQSVSKIQQEISNLQKEINNIKINAVDSKQATTKQYDIASDRVSKSVQDEIQKHLKDGDEIPLILTSVVTPEQKIATSKFNQLLHGSTVQRYTDAISKNNKNGWCYDSKEATLSFWAPYAMWTNHITLAFPSDFSKKTKSISIQLLLDNEVVYKSEEIIVKDSAVKVNLNDNIRFQRLRVLAKGGQSVCVGDVKGFTSKKVDV